MVFCLASLLSFGPPSPRAGVEVNGTTYVRFTKRLVTADPTFADACLSADQTYTLIYAYGQLEPNLTHEPASSLEIIPAAARATGTFYKPDELKFHGGGGKVGSYDGRGNLGAVQLVSGGGAAVAELDSGADVNRPDSASAASSRLHVAMYELLSHMVSSYVLVVVLLLC